MCEDLLLQVRIGNNAVDSVHGPETNPLCHATPQSSPVSNTFSCNEGQRPSLGQFAVMKKSNSAPFQGQDLLWSVADFQVEGEESGTQVDSCSEPRWYLPSAASWAKA